MQPWEADAVGVQASPLPVSDCQGGLPFRHSGTLGGRRAVDNGVIPRRAQAGSSFVAKV